MNLNHVCSERGGRLTYQGPADEWDLLQARFQQDDYAFGVARVAPEYPDVHPIEVSLMVCHDDQPIR